MDQFVYMAVICVLSHRFLDVLESMENYMESYVGNQD